MTDFKPNIWRLQAQLDTKGLIEALRNEDPSIRRRAAAALYALGAVEAVPSLIAALDLETDPEVRNNLVAAIAYLKPEVPDKVATAELELAPLNRFIAQLSSDDPDRIIQSARALGELKDKIAVEPLVEVFRKTETPPQVRLAVAEALLLLESAPAEVTLLGALRSKQWHLRRNAAAILGQLRADWAVVPLGVALHDENELVSRTARAALERIGTAEALKVMKEAPDYTPPGGIHEHTPPAPPPLASLKRIARSLEKTKPTRATKPKKNTTPQESSGDP